MSEFEKIFTGRTDFPEKLHPVCESCINLAHEKYDGTTSLDGIYYKDGFGVGCPFIPANETYFNEKLRSQFSAEDWKLTNSFRAPLLWGEANLMDPDTGRPWKAWPYQKGPLLCQSPRKCYRFGRRCLEGHSLITMADGTQKPITEVKPGEEVVSFDVNTCTNTTNRILNFWENGEQETYRVSFLGGQYLLLTSNHPLLTKNGWLSIDEGLSAGEYVVTANDYLAPGFKPIASITKMPGVAPTFDIEVEGNHNFIANGIYSHNTGKTVILSVEILWYLFTSGGGLLRDEQTKKVRQNLEVLVLAPQKVHINLIFSKIRSFLSLSPKLQAAIKTDVRGSPQVIGLATANGQDGNKVAGYASGDSSGSKGLAARGQSADLVVMDEGAYVSEEVINNVVSPILYTRPTTTFIISSTPSGISGDYFEKVCRHRPDFVEFYVPASERPDWAQMEAQVKKEFGGSDEEWKKEVMAEFTPAGIGVYKDDLVKFAQSEYEYGTLKPNPAMVYTIGVDWNKEHGTEIAIVGTQKMIPHISWVAHCENITKEEFTTPFGVERLINLNQIWKPAWIYVDAGGGDSGQTLRHHGRQMIGKDVIAARLKDIVKSIDFGSKMDIVESGGNINSLPIKPFMVNNSVKKMELGELKYPRTDIVLTRQFNNYIVARRTPAGVPVYGVREPKYGDHRLDAVNLALLAVRLEFTSFTGEGLGLMTNDIKYVPPSDAPVSPRILFPVSVPNRANPIRARNPLAQKNPKGMTVNYWGNAPTEAEVEHRYNTPYGRRNIRRIGR